MTPGILILKVKSGSHARELIDDIFGVDSFVVGDKLLTIYGDDAESWFEPLAFTLTEQEFFRRFLGGGISQPIEGTNKMSAVMDNAKKIVHGAAAAIGLVDIKAEVNNAAFREGQRQLLASKEQLLEDVRRTARELETVNAKIESGELWKGAERTADRAYRQALAKSTLVNSARQKLFNSSPAELQRAYFFHKREFVSLVTRINLLTRQQIPDAERALATAKERAASADKTAAKCDRGRDMSTRANAAEYAAVEQRTMALREYELNMLRDELATAEQKLAGIQAQLAEAEAAVINA